jgi:hypothetical protein
MKACFLKGYRAWKEARNVRRRARFQQHRDASCHQLFFLHGKARKKIHAILTQTLQEHSSSYATVINWVAAFNHGDFSPVMRLVLDDPKQ